jgi:ABC-type transporter Mla MlaB component
MRLSTRGLNCCAVTIESARGVVTVRCRGRLVRGQETALLCAVVQQHGRDIILDLSGVTAIDAAGIGALVSLQAAGSYLRLVGPSLGCTPNIEAYKSGFRLRDLRIGIQEGDNGTRTSDRIGTHATTGIYMIELLCQA